jgi:nucleotide-binding universal stress UspA family protein
MPRFTPSPASPRDPGMAGVRRFLLGSVPNKISHHAPSSVLIVQTS